MRLRFALAADFAQVTQEGKLNVLGVVERIFAPNYPAVHRQIFLVLSLESENDDEEQIRHMHVQFLDPDAQILSEIRGEMHFGPGRQILNQIHHFQDTMLNQAGSYEFAIFFEEKLVHTVPIEVQLIEPAPGS